MPILSEDSDWDSGEKNIMNKAEVYQYLTEKNILYEAMEHKAVFNMEELNAIELPYPEWDAKNLFVRDQKKQNYYLITVRGDKRVDLKEFRKKHGLRALSFASPEELDSILGLIPGAVTPLGILNDTEHRVHFYLDAEFMRNKIGVHPNDNAATVWLQADDLIKLIRENGNEAEYVEICEKMNHYRVIENESYVEGRKLLAKDKLSFAVMVNILGASLKKIVTNDTDVIIAHSAKVFPTWIWAPDECSTEKMEEIYQTFKKEFQPLPEYRINTKYKIAEYLLKRLKEDGYSNSGITTNIAAYECHVPIQPDKKVDGQLQQLGMADFELTVRLIREASIAIGDRILSEEEAVQAAEEQLKRQVLYVWRNGDGKAVSFCDRNENTNYVAISQVYTPEEERGKGYAAEMIYQLCSQIVKNGQIPMLYADADYHSSNRCYQKIGFELEGKIATIGINA